MSLRLQVCLVVAFVVGCSNAPYDVVPVGGQVTLDGKPLPKASVTFVPMATKTRENPGPTSQGVTDPDGRFQVSIDQQTPGAVVGKSRIYISTILSDPLLDDRDAGGPRRIVRDRVPKKYNQGTELT